MRIKMTIVIIQVLLLSSAILLVSELRAQATGKNQLHSAIRMNFDERCEELINDQIRVEMEASYTYLAMSHFFAKPHQALPGFQKFFLQASKEEQEHAQLILDYMAERGGIVNYKNILAPNTSAWNSTLTALKGALALEKQVNQKLLTVHKCASGQIDTEDDLDLPNPFDPHMTNFLEETLLKEQVTSIHELGHLISRLERFGFEPNGAINGLGEHLMDKELAELAEAKAKGN